MAYPKRQFVLAHQHVGKFLRCRPVIVALFEGALRADDEEIQDFFPTAQCLDRTVDHGAVGPGIFRIEHFRRNIMGLNDRDNGQGYSGRASLRVVFNKPGFFFCGIALDTYVLPGKYTARRQATAHRRDRRA